MKKQILAAVVLGMALAASSAPLAEKPVLAGYAHVADIETVSSSIARMGGYLGQAMISGMIVGNLQRWLTGLYGPIRSKVSGATLAYVNSSALDEGVCTNCIQKNLNLLTEYAVVFPLDQDLGSFTNAHPFATVDDGSIVHILPAQGRPNDTFVMFCNDGRAVFAPSAKLARQAAADSVSILAENLGENSVTFHVTAAGIRVFALKQIAQAMDTAGAGVVEVDIDEDTSTMRAASPADSRVSVQQAIDQAKIYDRIDSLSVTLGVTDAGLDITGFACAKPNKDASKAAKVEPCRLDAALLSALTPPADAVYFSATRYSDDDVIDLVSKVHNSEKFLSDEFSSLLANLCKVPSIRSLIAERLSCIDWRAGASPAKAGIGWCAFDSKMRPGFFEKTFEPVEFDLNKMAEKFSEFEKSAEKDFPNQKFISHKAPHKGALTACIDINAAFDAIIANAETEDESNKVTNVRKMIVSTLGESLVIQNSVNEDATAESSLCAADAAFAAPAASTTAWNRVSESLPALKSRPLPARVLWVSPIAAVRSVLKAYSASAPAEQASFLQSVVNSIPVAPGKGIGSAIWKDDDRADIAIRVSADELRGVGMMVGAFSGMAMSRSGGKGSADKDDDDE